MQISQNYLVKLLKKCNFDVSIMQFLFRWSKHIFVRIALKYAMNTAEVSALCTKPSFIRHYSLHQTVKSGHEADRVFEPRQAGLGNVKLHCL
jgi:hypothetical protein